MLLLAGGCVKETEACTDPGAVSTVGYLAIRLERADGLTRAVGDNFAYGKREEFALAPGSHHFAIFYNDSQTLPLAIASLSNMVDREGSDKTANSTVAFAAIAAQSEQKEMLERLQECFVILNANIDPESLWRLSKTQLRELVVQAPFCRDAKGNEYLTMCNSVYVDGGAVAMATKVDTSKIYTSYLEAIEMAWKGEAAVEAYVERVAAKIGLRLEAGSYDNTPAERTYTPANNQLNLFTHLNDDIPHYSGDFSYKISLTGWGMNALEQESYLFRNIDANGNYFDGWYDPLYRRAYWSVDRNYKAATYPWQYRKAVDDTAVVPYAESRPLLRNLSYTELNADRFSRDCIYIPENTYDFKDASFGTKLDGRPELLAGSHLIVCADLLTNLENADTYKAYDLYRDRNGNFYRSERECFLALVTAMNNNLKSHSFLKYTYYDWTNGGGGETLFAKTNGEYSLYWNDTKLTPENIERIAGELTTDATLRNGDGQRFIWMEGMSVRNDAGEAMEVYSNIDEVDSTQDRWLRTSTVNDVKSLLLQYIGPVDHFQEGKMYYAVPVGYVKDEAGSTPESDRYSIYGIVRNSVYDILIHDVTGLGTSVDRETEPIVPNQVATHDRLFISIDILHWHEVDQNVPGVIN